MDFKIQPFTSEYLVSLTRLLDSSFAIKNKDKIPFVKWKYFSRFHNNDTISYIAIDSADEVVSYYANIPVPVVAAKKEYHSMICTDMTTRSDYRGKRLISHLSDLVYKEVRQKHYDFSIGFSNDEGIKVDTYARNYGYQIVGKFIRYVKLVIRKKKTDYTLIKTDHFTNDILANKNSPFFEIKKDKNYLDWRYIQPPNNTYKLFTIVKDGDAKGYVILRFLNNKCYVYDIVAKRNDLVQMINVVRSIENTVLQSGINIVIYNVLDNTYWQNLFRSYKYLKRVKNTVNYYLTVKLHPDFKDTESILSNEHWLLMNGDIL